MTGSRDLEPSTWPFYRIFYQNQFKAKPQWPKAGTDLSRKVACITGANTGLGLETVRQLLGLKISHVILAVRSLDKGEAVAVELRKKYPSSRLDVWQLDMSSYQSIETFVQKAQSLPQLDYVMLNAGVIKSKFSVLKTGHEETFQVNYLSTMLLAVLLLPVLKSKRMTEPAHLSVVGASLALVAKFPNQDDRPIFASLDNSKMFDAATQYDTSKVMAHMFLWKLVDYVSAEDVIVSLADPSWTRGTDIGRDFGGATRVFLKLFALTGRNPDVGASCLVDALINKGKESHGCLIMSWKIHPFAASLYTPKGKVTTEQVWIETMQELAFANVQGILDGMKSC